MAFADVMKKLFPFISAGASLGGPIGVMAATVVGKALGIDKLAPTQDAITNAIAAAMTDPAQRAALLKAEQDFQLQMTEMGFKDAEEMASIAAADRASARNMQVQVKSKMPAVLSLLAVGTLAFCIYMIGFHTLPVTGHDAMLILLGAVTATYKDIYGYFFGSSAGSDRKTEIMATENAH
jgi:hypothetical protein